MIEENRTPLVAAYQIPRGFTLIEVLLVVLIIGVIAVFAYPSATALKTEADQSRCTANLHEIAAIKYAWVIDHPGDGGPRDEGEKSTFRAYFTEGFSSVSICPIHGDAYPNIYDVYSRTICPECGGKCTDR